GWSRTLNRARKSCRSLCKAHSRSIMIWGCLLMGKLAFVFAGQGAQKIGMGKALAENFPAAMEVFDKACEALQFDVKNMMWNGDNATLMITENTQPCIVTMSLAALAVLEEKGIRADVVAGLSLGEYTAHVAAGSLKLGD